MGRLRGADDPDWDRVREEATPHRVRAGRGLRDRHLTPVSDPPSPPRPDRSPADLLLELRARGALRLEVVTLRANRRTIWSLTAGGQRFNLHRAFSEAPVEILEDLAVIAREARRRSLSYQRAAERVAGWPTVVNAIRALRIEGEAEGLGVGPCCATADQRTWLDDAYRTINRSRFGHRLPEIVPLRLSSRMRSRLGQMVPGVDVDGVLYPVEIALNADLMLRRNDRVRTETLVHEMAHVADVLEHGQVGHGPTWRRIAEQAGCEPRACRRGSIQRRPPGTPPTTRVPPPLRL